MYLIRLAFAASAVVVAATVGLEARMVRRAGWAFIRGGERTSVSAGNEAYHPASPRVSDLLSLSTFPPLLASSCPPRRPFLALVVEDENRIYIPSLARPGKYYERVYAPAATSYDKRARRRRKIELSSLRYSRRVLNLTALQIFLHSQILSVATTN